MVPGGLQRSSRVVGIDTYRQMRPPRSCKSWEILVLVMLLDEGVIQCGGGDGQGGDRLHMAEMGERSLRESGTRTGDGAHNLLRH